jgi:DNA-binding PadR family transcriptional regulator
VRSNWEEDAVAQEAKRPRRRYYEMTSEGTAALAAARERFRMLAPGRGPTGEPEPSPA